MKETWDTLTNEELCIEYQKTRDNILFEYFLSRNHGLMMDYLNPIIRKYPEQKDGLEQAGRTAMWEAMCKFDPMKEVKFSTYVHYFFRKNVWRHRHEEINLIKIPINLLTKLDEVREKVPYAVFGAESMDKTIYDTSDSGHETTLEETIAADQPDPLELAIQEERGRILLKILSKLRPRESTCIQMYYGLNGYKQHTLQMIGKEYGVTRERIRQILTKALKRIKSYYLKEKYDDEE